MKKEASGGGQVSTATQQQSATGLHESDPQTFQREIVGQLTGLLALGLSVPPLINARHLQGFNFEGAALDDQYRIIEVNEVGCRVEIYGRRQGAGDETIAAQAIDFVPWQGNALPILSAFCPQMSAQLLLGGQIVGQQQQQGYQGDGATTEGGISTAGEIMQNQNVGDAYQGT